MLTLWTVVEKPDKPEGDGFGKIYFLASSRIVWGAWPDRLRLLCLTSDGTLNALVAVNIAVTADCCDFSR